ncbi:putative metallophosphoesterase domain-containing protein [Aspergillus affinis]|uniref:putative metallophosphoesterase domain-containing protein n=1 Tax=Aspergillus affinis TaxID=1070780 RepID=UPI0022FEA57E|nr:putative metallophosphoesterase domain-containing protein [Aspergillus affinis]KAI9038879.1 putative metallophosphoesterase domain-containing protein [Aspergillus affinis]
MYSAPTIRTKFLVISDTHGRESSLQHLSTECADVAIHCGDLTTDSTLAEFRSSISFLSSLNTPLKLVIAGNHDFTLDTPTFQRKLALASEILDPALVKKAYGDFGYARSLFEEAMDNGIKFLDQGTHHFTLENGASLTVYASPYTPSMSPGDWGFEYSRSHGHNFEFKHVDVVITHGPPKGIMDYNMDRERAGCPELFAAVRRAKPRMHCFGHINEQWGAKLVTWRKGSPSREPCHFGDVDHRNSFVIERLSNLQGEKEDEEYERFYRTSHCTGDEGPVKWEEQTLFVNAAIEGVDGRTQPAWVVEIELSRAF